MDRAAEHAAAGRYGEALSELQAVIEEHRGDLLAAERPVAPGAGASAQPVHPGAARRARERLLRLPPEARALYRQRYEHDASLAFERARDRGDRGDLAEVARQWPLTEAGQRAWWALGDLELERGEVDKAHAAWRRALAALLDEPDLVLATSTDWARAEQRLQSTEGAASPARAGALRRVSSARIALDTLESHPTLAAPSLADGLHPVPALGAPRGPLPELESWPESRDLPQHPFKNSDALFPVRAGDALLVSTSLRLIAFHAWSGALLWDSGECEGWSEIVSDRERGKYFEGIDDAAAIIAPAAGGRVALAALQIPLTFVDSFHYSANVPVTTIIPDRRLFAFDLETGHRLWSHDPPAGWDGESGSFAQRMSVAGPPIVCGSRVLAPFYRLQGRIDYHVGCFDLDTGALLWSTALISGQRELNMFGRAEHEFSAPPLVVSGDRVVALTQLGTIAAIDLFTGELLWETLYDQIPLPKNSMGGFRAPARRSVWRNAPPVVADGVVLATPYDSIEMVGLDLESGGVLWSLPHQTVAELAGGSAVDLLVGVRGNSAIVSGNGIGAISAPRGLRLSPPAVARWSFSDDKLLDGIPWRPVLAGSRVVIPLKEERIEIDAESGSRLATVPWSPGKSGGNLVVGPGEVSSLSLFRATGWFDWNLLTERARADLAAHPGDVARALELGRLLADRGASEWQRGQSDAARAHLAEAEATLEGTLAGFKEGEVSPAGTEMHRVLRTEARLKSGLADRAGALAALRRARALAPDNGALRDTLLEELILLRGNTAADPRRDAAYADALAALERCCADLPIVCDTAAADAGDTERAPAAGVPRLTPIVGSLARRESNPWEIPTGLWVLFERIAAANVAGDARAELVDLHAVLERYPDIELPQGSAGSVAADRIAVLIHDGNAEGYEAFETRAQKLYDEALSARDGAKLALVGRLYPHSHASQNADDQRLAWAMERGDAAAVAAIVQAMLPRAWHLADATEREVRALLRLSSAMSRAGNRELAAQLSKNLAVARGGVRSDLDGDGGRTLAELGAGIARWQRADPTRVPGHFRDLRREGRALTFDWEILGRVPADDGSRGEGAEPAGGLEEYAVIRTSDRGFVLVNALVGRPERDPDLEFAFADVRIPVPQTPLGVVNPPWSRRTALAPGRILVATGAGVSAIDTQGRMVWAWRPEGATPASLTLAYAAGIVVVSADLGSGRRFLQALDVHAGIELWRVPVVDPGLSPVPVLSANKVVLLPARSRRKGLALDLVTGRDAVAFQLDSPASGSTSDDAWIDGDLLIVPWFLQSREPSNNQVIAIDLTTGARAWRVAIGGDRPDAAPANDPASETDRDEAPDPRELLAVLQHGERSWLLIGPPISSAAAGAAPATTLVELATHLGAVSPLPNVRIAPSDRVFGLLGTGRIRLPSTTIFLLNAREGSTEARVRAVDLESGEVWVQPLVHAFGDLVLLRPPFSPAPQPVLSTDAVAIVYSLNSKTGMSFPTFVECFDRGSGRDLGSLPMSPAMGRCDAIKLYPLGAGLLVRGQSGLEVLR
jgi:outer membrane protein assembly factor BamB/tetratricopeptide (TPR) repeat protein